jgi:hypothetical protein
VSEPLILPRNCGNCHFFDGDCHCALSLRHALIPGYIADPAKVACEKHEPKDADDEQD